MAIKFHCESCGKKLKARADQAGARFECGDCGAQARVPKWQSEVSHSTVQRGEASAFFEQAAETASGEKPIEFGKKERQEDDLDMTPMVDVTFLLLIFFMITAAFSLQKSLEIPSPDREEAASQTRTIEEMEENDDFIIVTVDQESIVWVEDREAPTRQELIALLNEKRGDGTGGPSNLMVIANEEARHEQVVMVLDVGNQLGIEHIRLATDKGDF